MPSIIDAEFARSFQPLPTRDRRLLLREMGVEGVSHRDEIGFYEWLAERYLAGEAGLVDQALTRCCAKADERSSTRRMIHWLKGRTGLHEPEDRDPQRAFEILVEAAWELTDGTAEILAALSPSFPWLTGNPDEIEDVEEILKVDDLAPKNERDTSTHVNDGDCASAAGNYAAGVIVRLRSLLDNLEIELPAELIEQAEALASAIENHFVTIEGQAREVLARRDALAERLFDHDETLGHTLLSRGDPVEIAWLEEIEEALDQFRAASSAVDAAQNELREAAAGDRARRKSANDKLDAAEETLERAREALAGRVASDGTTELNALEGAMRHSPENFFEVVTVTVDEVGVPQTVAAPVPHEEDHDANRVAGGESEQESQIDAKELEETKVEAVGGKLEPTEVTVEQLASAVASQHESDGEDLLRLEERGPISPPEVNWSGATDGQTTVETSGLRITVPNAEPGRNGKNSWETWIGAALGAGRLGLALHLADARQLAGEGENSYFPHITVQALLHGSGTQAAYDRAWQDYEALRDALAAEATQEGWDGPTAASLLLYAGAIRPAILQSSGAWTVIEALEGDVAAALNPLTMAVRELREARIANFTELEEPAGEEDKRKRKETVRRELEQWWGQATRRTTSFQRATLVWQAMVGSDGPLGQACALALADGNGAGKAVDALIAPIYNDIEAEIARVHEMVAKRARLDPIEGNALKQLKNLIAGAIEHLERWRQTRGVANGDDRHRVRRVELLQALAAARQTAIGFAVEGPLASAGAVFDTVMRDLSEQLAGRPPMMLTPSEALDWEIALLPDFPLNARRSFRLGADDVEPLFQSAQRLSHGLPSPQVAFDGALEVGATSNAARLVPHLPEEARAGAQDAWDETVRAERKRLLERTRGIRSRLDDLQIALTENRPEVDELEREITGLEQVRVDELPRETGEAGDLADFPTAHRELDRIERKLDAARAPVRQRLDQRIIELEGRLGQRLEECRTQLADGDLGTLAEELDQIGRYGLAGPPEGTPLALLREFTGLVEALGDNPTLQFGNLPRAAREGRREGAIEFSNVPPDDRARAERLLAALNQLRRAVMPQPRSSDASTKMRKAVADVLAGLGFTGVRVESCDREKAWFYLNASLDPLRSREMCLVPAFGSERAKARESVASYAIVVVSGHDIASALARFDSLPNQVLIFITEPLSPRQRREFQRKARSGTRAVALADALTLATLAKTPLAGPRQFFDLAIPYGAAQPYADKGSETSIEMFFGREEEMRRLVDPNGACFVYGGRQLGKTALLKQIEMRENASPDRVAIYCDIKPVGESSSTEQVWRQILDKLRDRKLSLPNGATVAERLRAWVDARPGRYLLILLDEADAFLEREMLDNFPIVGEMKDLMAHTRRGIKFVFAGLHNVQRFYRAPNSPLLHLGAPINVGPLLGNDREAAREMAFEPMAALGFEFARRTDAYYMLSLVGFYPSLMQSFGKAVVEAMNDRLKRPGESGEIPAAITRAIIEGCFERQTFRDSVVERFRQTLKLDERYELVTYAVWQRTQEDNLAGRPAAHGYPASEIFRLATEWWPAGFRDTDSLDSFTAILDEMFEMGVLAREGERYALRSQRIAAMLGGKAEIDDQLLGLTERAPRRRPDPLTSHRQIDKRWSPLSLRQEATLRSRWASSEGSPITLIGAVEASGLAGISEAVRTLSNELGWPDPRAVDSDAPVDKLAASVDVRRDTAPGNPRLLLRQGAWPSQRELADLSRHRALRDGDHPVRLVCIGSPTLASLDEPEDADWLRIALGPLPLDSMFHWMNRWHLAFAGEEAAQAQLRRASGGFLSILDRLTPSAAERDDLAGLIERAEQVASTITPADLGLEGALEAFARKFLIAIEDEQLADLSDWAREVDADKGARLAQLLEALGVIERTVGSDGGVLRGFNSVARRILS